MYNVCQKKVSFSWNNRVTQPVVPWRIVIPFGTSSLSYKNKIPITQLNNISSALGTCNSLRHNQPCHWDCRINPRYTTSFITNLIANIHISSATRRPLPWHARSINLQNIQLAKKRILLS